MSVLLRPDGSVEMIEVLQSSGHQILDDAALQIVKLSSPFPRFPKEITRNADKLEIIRTWRFEITGLSTN
jgi:protein TonB